MESHFLRCEKKLSTYLEDLTCLILALSILHWLNRLRGHLIGLLLRNWSQVVFGFYLSNFWISWLCCILISANFNFKYGLKFSLIFLHLLRMMYRDSCCISWIVQININLLVFLKVRLIIVESHIQPCEILLQSLYWKLNWHASETIARSHNSIGLTSFGLSTQF